MTDLKISEQPILTVHKLVISSQSPFYGGWSRAALLTALFVWTAIGVKIIADWMI